MKNVSSANSFINKSVKLPVFEHKAKGLIDPQVKKYTKEEYDKMDEDDKKRCRFVGRSNNDASANGGLVFADASYGSAYSSTDIGSRLAFKSRDLAIYCGKQFIDIWINYLFK